MGKRIRVCWLVLAVAALPAAPEKTALRQDIETHLLAPGHTVDNIVTWIADEKVLFGGCLVKAADAGSLGYTEESDLAAWPATLAVLKKRYSQARIIVAGHGDPGGWELVDNTLRLLTNRDG